MIKERLRAFARLIGDRNIPKESYLRAGAAFLVFLLLVLLFTWLRFPGDRLGPLVEERLYRKLQPRAVTIEKTRRTFFPGVTFSQVTIIEKSRANEAPLATLDQVTLKPRYFSTFTGDPGVDGLAELFGGILSFSIVDNDGMIDIAFDGEKIAIGEAAAWDLSPWGRLAVPLSGAGELSVAATGSGDGEGDVHLFIGPGKIIPGKSLGESFGAVIERGEIKAAYRNRKVAVQDFLLTGPDLTLTGKGEIVIGERVERSTLSLTLNLKLGGALKEKLGPFMGFAKPDGKGGKVIRIQGTLARPKII